MPATEQAQNFSDSVTLALRANRRSKKKPANITELAKAIGYTRETVSRAINHGEFPPVVASIARCLRVAVPTAS